MRAALIDTTGLVVNVIRVGDGYEPPDGLTLVELADEPIGPGWTYDGETWTEPEPVEPEPTPPSMEEQIAALREALSEQSATIDELIIMLLS